MKATPLQLSTVKSKEVHKHPEDIERMISCSLGKAIPSYTKVCLVLSIFWFCQMRGPALR
jgi:hypothetical protein